MYYYNTPKICKKILLKLIQKNTCRKPSWLKANKRRDNWTNGIIGHRMGKSRYIGVEKILCDHGPWMRDRKRLEAKKFFHSNETAVSHRVSNYDKPEYLSNRGINSKNHQKEFRIEKEQISHLILSSCANKRMQRFLLLPNSQMTS